VKHVEHHRKRPLIFESDSDEDPQLSPVKKRKGNLGLSSKWYCALDNFLEEGCSVRGFYALSFVTNLPSGSLPRLCEYGCCGTDVRKRVLS
jgi:hypothetical protein